MLRFLARQAMLPRNSNGVVLIVVILLLTIMLTLGTLMVKNMATEVNISGNFEVSTRSLFVAEGGLESIKADANNAASSKFSASGYTSGVGINTQEFTVSGMPDTTLAKATVTNPINWVQTPASWNGSLDWCYDQGTGPDNRTGHGACPTHPPATVFPCPAGFVPTPYPAPVPVTNPAPVYWCQFTNANGMAAGDLTTAYWPIYKTFTIGADQAFASAGRPRWDFSSLSNGVRGSLINFPLKSSADSSFNPKLYPKQVSSSIEIDMGNNFLTFQSFVNPANLTAFKDNCSTASCNVNDAVTIGAGKGCLINGSGAFKCTPDAPGNGWSAYQGLSAGLPEYDGGIYPSDVGVDNPIQSPGAITGIATYNPDTSHQLVIQYCPINTACGHCNNADNYVWPDNTNPSSAPNCTVTQWQDYGIPDYNKNNSTFILGVGHGCVLQGYNAAQGVSAKGGVTGQRVAAGTFPVNVGDQYKVVYKNQLNANFVGTCTGYNNL